MTGIAEDLIWILNCLIWILNCTYVFHSNLKFLDKSWKKFIYFIKRVDFVFFTSSFLKNIILI